MLTKANLEANDNPANDRNKDDLGLSFREK